MSYKYRAYTIDKKIVQGTISAADEGVAEEALYQKGYRQILSMEEAPSKKTLEELVQALFQPAVLDL